MDSTMLYQLVLEQLHTGKQLINLLPPLGSLLNPHSNIATNHMNDQQIFAQIHKSVAKALSAQQTETSQLLASIQQPSEPEQESSLEEQQLHEDDGGNDWEADQIEGEHQQLQGEQEQQQQGESFEKIDEEENEDQMEEEDDLGQEEAYQGEEDVGLYGEEIDQEEMESYQNEGNSEQERQFEAEEKNLSKGRRRNFKQDDQEQADQGEDLINDQFDHFRQVQLQNKEQPQTSQEKTELQKQIEKLEDKIISKKDWVLRGEVKATQRPVNSLLQYDLQFKTGIRLDQEITPEVNTEIQKMIKQRILDDLYDDRVRYQHSHVLREQYSSLKEVSREKSKLGLGQLYQAEFKNYLGLGDNKNDKLKQDILQAFKEVNFYLDSLSNFNFTPRPTTGTKNEVVISQEKVPINMWKGTHEQSTHIERKIVSEKQQNNKAKRIKNKRIARQRKKEQDRKKLNKKIEYGGMTKFQAKAMAQKAKNNLKKDNVKYNKSANFFAEMNKEKKGKPNPHIGKLKI